MFHSSGFHCLSPEVARGIQFMTMFTVGSVEANVETANADIVDGLCYSLDVCQGGFRSQVSDGSEYQVVVSVEFRVCELDGVSSTIDCVSNLRRCAITGPDPLAFFDGLDQ